MAHALAKGFLAVATAALIYVHCKRERERKGERGREGERRKAAAKQEEAHQLCPKEERILARNLNEKSIMASCVPRRRR